MAFLHFRPPPHPADFKSQHEFYNRHSHDYLHTPFFVPPRHPHHHRHHRGAFYDNGRHIGPMGALELGFVGPHPPFSAAHPQEEKGRDLTREDEDNVLFGHDSDDESSGSSEEEEGEEDRMMQERAVGQAAMRDAELSGAKMEPRIVEYEAWEEFVEPALMLPGGSASPMASDASLLLPPLVTMGRAGNFLFFAKADPRSPTDAETVGLSLERLVARGALSLAKIQEYEKAFVQFQRRDVPMKKALVDAYIRRFFAVEPSDRLPSKLNDILAAIVINTKYFLCLLRACGKRIKQQGLEAAPKMATTTQADVDRAKEALLLSQPPVLAPAEATAVVASASKVRSGDRLRQPTVALWEDAFESRNGPVLEHLYYRAELPRVLDNEVNFHFLYRSRPTLYTTEKEFFKSMDDWLELEFLILDPPVIQDFINFVAEARAEPNPVEPILRYLGRYFVLDADALAAITPEYVDKLWANTEAVVRRLKYYLKLQLERLEGVELPPPWVREQRLRMLDKRHRPLPSDGQYYATGRSPNSFRDFFEADWRRFNENSFDVEMLGGADNWTQTGLPPPQTTFGEDNFVFLYRGRPEWSVSREHLRRLLEKRAAVKPLDEEIDYFLQQYTDEIRRNPTPHVAYYLKQHFAVDEDHPFSAGIIEEVWKNTLDVMSMLQGMRTRVPFFARQQQQVRSDKRTRSVSIPFHDRLTALGIISSSSGPIPAATRVRSSGRSLPLRSNARLEITILEYDHWAELVEPLSFAMPRQSDLAQMRDLARHFDSGRSFLFALKATPALLSGHDAVFNGLAHLDARRQITGEDVRNYIQDLAIYLCGDEYAVGSGPETIGLIRATLKEFLANVNGERSMNTLYQYLSRHYALETATDEEIFAIEWRDLASIFWQNTGEFLDKLLEYYEPRLRFMPTDGSDDNDDGGWVDVPRIIASNARFGSPLALASAAPYRLKDEAILNIVLSDQSKRLSTRDDVPGDPQQQWGRADRDERMTYITYRPKRNEGLGDRLINNLRRLKVNSVRLEPHEILVPTFYAPSYAPVWYGAGRFGVLPTNIVERLPRLPAIGRYAEGDQITDKLYKLRDMFRPLADLNDLEIIPAFGTAGGRDRFIWVARNTVY